jgi:hypothetical protein
MNGLVLSWRSGIGNYYPGLFGGVVYSVHTRIFNLIFFLLYSPNKLTFSGDLTRLPELVAIARGMQRNYRETLRLFTKNLCARAFH